MDEIISTYDEIRALIQGNGKRPRAGHELNGVLAEVERFIAYGDFPACNVNEQMRLLGFYIGKRAKRVRQSEIVTQTGLSSSYVSGVLGYGSDESRFVPTYMTLKKVLKAAIETLYSDDLDSVFSMPQEVRGYIEYFGVEVGAHTRAGVPGQALETDVIGLVRRASPDVSQLAANGRHEYIYGAPGFGKSTFLNQVRIEAQQAHRHVVVVNVPSLHVEEPDSMGYHLARAINPSYVDEVGYQAGENWTLGAHVFASALEALEAEVKKQITILFDDSNISGRRSHMIDEVLHFTKSRLNSQGRPQTFRTVSTGYSAYDRSLITSSEQHIQSFSLEETVAFASALKKDEDAAREVFAHTQGHPLLTHAMLVYGNDAAEFSRLLRDLTAETLDLIEANDVALHEVSGVFGESQSKIRNTPVLRGLGVGETDLLSGEFEFPTPVMEPILKPIFVEMAR